jgi:hypothetical protein
MAQTDGTLVLRMAQADLLPYDFASLADTLHVYTGELKALLEARRTEANERKAALEMNAYKLTSDPRRPMVAPPALEIPPFLNFAPLDNALTLLDKAAARYSKARAEAGKRASGENWRVARNVMVAPTDAEARDRVFGEKASNRYLFDYVRTVLDRVGLLSVMKPRPDMPDKEATVEAIIDGCTLYGSPRTMLDKLVAFREEVGPFDTLLMTGVDWAGPNEAWERQSMQLLAQEVMPTFRQHVLAQGAE